MPTSCLRKMLLTCTLDICAYIPLTTVHTLMFERLETLTWGDAL